MRTASQPRLDDAATVVRQFNAAWNDHDLTATLALTSDDCVFEATSPAVPRSWTLTSGRRTSQPQSRTKIR